TAGALAYAVTLSNGMVGRIPPAGFGNMLTLGDGTARFVTEADTAVQANVGSVDPQWRWFYQDDPTCTPATPCTWLASVLALNRGGSAPPPNQPPVAAFGKHAGQPGAGRGRRRAEEHTSELQSRGRLAGGLLLEKKIR